MLLKGNGLWLIVLVDFNSYPWLAEIKLQSICPLISELFLNKFVISQMPYPAPVFFELLFWKLCYCLVKFM